MTIKCLGGQKILNESDNFLNMLPSITLRATTITYELNRFLIRVLHDKGFYPSSIIQQLWNSVWMDLETNPNTKVFELINPREAVWEGSPPILEIYEGESRQDIIPYVFIHGIENDGGKKDAFEFYRKFEMAAQMFKHRRAESKRVKIFIVSYDSRMSNKAMEIIKNSLKELFGGSFIAGDALGCYKSVFWKELERRAEVIWKSIRDRIIPLTTNGTQLRVISHSLGCYVIANMLHQMYNPREAYYPIKFWLCMAAALPYNAFTEIGKFNNVTKMFEDHTQIKVWFSTIDSILSNPYSWATHELAMGQFGAALGSLVSNVDTTLDTHVIHRVSDGYFDLLSYKIQEFLMYNENYGKMGFYT